MCPPVCLPQQRDVVVGRRAGGVCVRVDGFDGEPLVKDAAGLEGLGGDKGGHLGGEREGGREGEVTWVHL